MPTALIQRGFRFSVVGLLCTLLAYAVFVPLVRLGVPYLAANFAAWLGGVLVGFVLNRAITFRIRGKDGLLFQLGKFVVGSLMQLALASLGYWILIGMMHLGPTVAFVINLVLTAGFMFVYLNTIAFRR